MEVVNALKLENESLKDVIQKTRAERIAIDQMYVQKTKEEFTLKTQIVMLNEMIQQKDLELNELRDKLQLMEKQVSSEAA